MTREYSKQYMVDYDRARREEALRREKAIDKALGIEEEKKPAFNQFKKGDMVNHNKYGIGKVMKQDKMIVTVKFEAGKKQIQANFLQMA